MCLDGVQERGEDPAFPEAGCGPHHREVAAVAGQVVAALMPADEPQETLVLEAERLLATIDGLCIHALLQPEWMTARMCSGVLERHLDGLGH